LPLGLDFERGIKWLKAAITHNLKVDDTESDVIERGGVVALVGPTGVGKTTTVAKLAAHAVLRFGASNVALLSTDSYRIGAHEQLRIYGRILNVPVYAIKEESELDMTLADLQRSHLVLVDTVGMSQRDRNLPDQIKFLCGDNRQVKRQLILPATAQGVTLDDIVRAHQGVGLDGCILTKVDESVSLAPAIDCLIRHGLKLHYVTNGQRVPEDIRTANAAYLVDRAFKGQSSGAMQLNQEEMVLQGDWTGTGDLFG
jgi:flagellar biosynthesis protein FlhF